MALVRRRISRFTRSVKFFMKLNLRNIFYLIKITVFADRFTVKFKSGLAIDIEA